MKKLLFTAVSALAIAGVSVAADSTEFGVLYVPSTAKETIVSVPWLESGTGNDDVKVADLVLTAGLALNDELMLYTGSGTSYKCWILSDDGKGGRCWKPGTTVSSTAISTAAGENDATLKRGQAILLKRKSDSITKGFYIMGKPAATASGTITIPGSSTGVSVYTLIAPSATSAFAITDEAKWSGLTNLKDHMTIDIDGTTTTWTYTTKSGWKKPGGVAELSIPAGQGVWFYSEASGSKTLSY